MSKVLAVFGVRDTVTSEDYFKAKGIMLEVAKRVADFESEVSTKTPPTSSSKTVDEIKEVSEEIEEDGGSNTDNNNGGYDEEEEGLIELVIEDDEE